MKKLLALTLITVMVCALLAGCSGPAVDPVLESPSLSPSATATPSATPTVSPSVSPSSSVSPSPSVASPTPVVDDPTVEVIDAGFDELYKKCDYVLIGTLTKSLGEWNQFRDPKDMSKPHATIFMMEKQYTIAITEVIKGKGLKAKDTVTLSLPYRNKFADDKAYTMLDFQEPTLNQSMMFFLGKDVVTKDVTVYYPENEPHSFIIKDNKLFTFGNSSKLAASFAKGGGTADKGFTLAAAKKEMGVK